MEPMAARRVFIDTNVLVYAADPSSPFHDKSRDSMQTLVEAGSELTISTQILREYGVVATRPKPSGLGIDSSALVRDWEVFAQGFLVLPELSDTHRVLGRLTGQYSVTGKQIHDAGIVATMLSHGVQELLTANVSDFNRFASEIHLLPLL